MLTIPATPTDEQEADGISPLLSRAPPPRPPPPPGPPSSAMNFLLPPPPPPPPPPINGDDSLTSIYPPPTSAGGDNNNDNDGDVIPDEHKRVPGLIPRSPLRSPTEFLRGLGIVARKVPRRKAPPPPIVVHPPPPPPPPPLRLGGAGHYYLAEGKTAVVEMVSVAGPDTAATTTTPATTHMPGLSPAAKPKRRTVWGMIEGWWDLGLLERMNTVRRKNGRS
ncbi:hypothetical protein MFIFM68171_08059 [Madurella fahalii]|uniref:Uncharacterized protein n=1 Tax=Madurella fahalii TaxID=1157608 RepID=A0ABQ0GJI2_9PEZI